MPHPNLGPMTETFDNDPPIEITAAVAPARAYHHAIVEAAAGWLAERGRVTDPDHLALICAASGQDPPRMLWTRTTVFHALYCDIPAWCRDAGCQPPVELPQALWSWLDFLHDTARLAAGSDPIAELRKPLCCVGWLDLDGTPLPPGAPRSIPCECLLPYRETAELLDDLIRQSERVGEDPLDRLRWLVGRHPRWPLAEGRLPWPDERPWPEGW